MVDLHGINAFHLIIGIFNYVRYMIQLFHKVYNIDITMTKYSMTKT